MLAGSSLDAGAAYGKAVHLRIVQRYAVVLAVFLDIAVSGLVRNSGDRSGLENVGFSEELLCIAVSPELVLSGEVKVDIRSLVSVEAKEGLEGYVVAVTVHILSADRALLRRQVVAGVVLTVQQELAVLALAADIVGLEGIYLRNSGHRSHKG